MKISLKNFLLVVVGFALLICLAAADRKTRLEIEKLRARNCTVYCSTSGPRFIRTFFLPNFRRKIELVALQQHTFTEIMGAVPDPEFAEIDYDLVAMLERADAFIYADKLQIEQLQKTNSDFKFIEIDNIRTTIGRLNAGTCGATTCQLLTSMKHLGLTSALIAASLSLPGWLVKRKNAG